MDEQPRLVYLDEDSRLELSLAALEAAGQGGGPRAEACRLAFAEYHNKMELGHTQKDAISGARSVLASFRGGR